MTKNYKSSNGQKASIVVQESLLGSFGRATAEYVDNVVQTFGHTIIFCLSLALVLGAYSLAGIGGALGVLVFTSVIIFDSLYKIVKNTKWAWLPVAKFTGWLIVASLSFVFVSCLYNPFKSVITS